MVVDRFKLKQLENFLHWIEGEPQTDMDRNEIKETVVAEEP